jgi:hypothetical protein
MSAIVNSIVDSLLIILNFHALISIEATRGTIYVVDFLLSVYHL